MEEGTGCRAPTGAPRAAQPQISTEYGSEMKNILLFTRRASPRATEAIPFQPSAPPRVLRPAGRGLPHARRLYLAAAGLAGSAAMVLLAVTLSLAPRMSLEGGSAQLSPDTPVILSLPRVGTTVAGITMTEASLDPNGAESPERAIPVTLAPAGQGLTSGLWSDLRVQRENGTALLSYDRVYRLHVSLRTKELAFPLPRDILVTRDYQFATLVTPQLLATQEVIQMGYQKPVELRWNSPLRQFSVETQPRVQTRSWVDPSRPDVAYVELQGANPGARYRILVTGAVGTNGASILAPAAVTVETAASPRPVAGSAKLEDGDRMVLRWDRPVGSLEYRIDPAIPSSLQVDPTDPKLTSILLHEAKQQQEYKITINGGTGTSGAPIAPGAEFSVVTPAPLEVTRLSPKGDSYGVHLDSPISITFGQPVKDRAAAQAAVTLDPAIEGQFEWPDANQLRFVPSAPLPDNTEVKVRIAGGPREVRGTDGSYLAEDYEYSFLTQPNKLIEVDLTHQTITLLEADKVVYSGLVAAGVQGAPTPTGTFMVDYKLPKTRMKGVNPDGSRYDIPDVPWVMSFQGDYTLHAAPWRNRFGYPGSNGCVSMETSQAKLLFDWSPVGTPVKIHY